MEPQDTFWWRLVHLDPAVFRGLVVAIVGLLATLGVAVAPGLPDSLIVVIVMGMAVIQGLWTRNGVTPNAKVVTYLADPSKPSAILPGDATTTASDSKILTAARASGDTP
jgi:hypothetical protein